MSIGTGLPRAFAQVEKIALILISTTLSISLLAGALLTFTLVLWLLGPRQLRQYCPHGIKGKSAFLTLNNSHMKHHPSNYRTPASQAPYGVACPDAQLSSIYP